MINKWKKIAKQVGQEIDADFSDKIEKLTNISDDLLVFIMRSGINHDELNTLIEAIKNLG